MQDKKPKIKSKCKKAVKVDASITSKKPKKKFNARSLVSLIILFVMGISSGLFAGDWFVNNFIGGPATDYSKFSEADLRQGNDSIILAYGDKVPTANDAWKSVVAAEYNAAHASSYDILSNGVVNTIITQTVYGRRIYDGSNVQIEQMSDGMVKVAKRYVYNPSTYNPDDPNSQITYQGSSSIGSKAPLSEVLKCPLSCSYNNKTAFIYKPNYGDKKLMSLEDFEEEIGGDPMNPIPYIISQKTVLKTTGFKVVKEDGKDKYCFSLELHPGASVLNYVRQMKTVSGLDGYPSFTSVKIDFCLTMIDGKVMFDCLDITEKYSVKYGTLAPKCSGTLHQRFLFNGDYEIAA